MRQWLDRLRGGRGGSGISPGPDDASAPYAPPDRQRRLADNPAMVAVLALLAVVVVVFMILLALR